MKNQNDLILSIAAAVVGLIAIVVIYATSPQAVRPADPAPADTSTPKLPAGDVVFANSLPGASSTAAGGGMGRGGFGGGGRGAGGMMPPGMGGGMPPGMGGGPSGMPGMMRGRGAGG